MRHLRSDLSTSLAGGGGGLFGGLVPIHRLGLAGQDLGQNVANMGDGDDFEPLLHIRRNLGQILFILFRNEDRLDPATQGRQQLFFQPSDGHGIAAQ